jgi:ATP-dependent Clp protease ATP-binding subunit ClpB
LKRLQKRLDERRIQLEMSPDAIKLLSETGFDPMYGARPLKRAIQKELETPLARALLSGIIKDGQKLNVQMRNGRIEFKPLG